MSAVGSYPTVSPLPLVNEWRSNLCGTIRRVQLSPCAPRSYLAACPLEPGLSSNKYHKDTNLRSSDHLPDWNI